MDGLAVIQGDAMHHFTECGLDYVWLKNGFDLRDGPNGRSVRIKNIDGLHRAIARWIVQSPARIRGQEVKFLRSMLKLSQEGMGKAIGQSRASVARWEGEPNKVIPTGSNHWMRIVYAKKAQGDREMCELVDLLIELDELKHGPAAPRQARFKDEAIGWAAA